MSLPPARAAGALVSSHVDITNMPAVAFPLTGIPLRYSLPIPMPRLIDNSLEDLHHEPKHQPKHQLAGHFQIF